MGDWVDIKDVKFKDVSKPCIKLGYCPYGVLVKQLPLSVEEDKYSCPIYGHHCPAYYHAEVLSPDMMLRVLRAGFPQRIGNMDLDVEEMVLRWAYEIKEKDWKEDGGEDWEEFTCPIKGYHCPVIEGMAYITDALAKADGDATGGVGDN